jgi:predicted nucleic acid-binding protein
MAFPAFLDTNVLYGAILNDTLLRIADEGAFRPHWSAEVLTELENALAHHAGLDRTRARRRIDQMQRAFPFATVEGHEELVAAMTCDRKDRHVLAAAIHSGCEVLVTFNTSDFPLSSTERYRVSKFPRPSDDAPVGADSTSSNRNATTPATRLSRRRRRVVCSVDSCVSALSTQTSGP